MKEKVLLLVAFALICGFTDCNHFSEVTVPTRDFVQPEIGVNVAFVPEPLTPWGVVFGPWGLTTTIYDGSWIVAPFGVDAGGIKRFQVHRVIRTECRGVWRTVENVVEADIDGVGDVGDRVSNGRYLILNFNPKDYASRSCKRVELRWDSIAEDYHGNTDSSWGEIRYLRPG